LERGDRWVRIEDGEPVTIVKRLNSKVRYTFTNHGTMVTKLSRFIRKYQPAPSGESEQGMV
jgi:hypothetical protein